MNYGQPHPSTHPHLVKEGESTSRAVLRVVRRAPSKLMMKVVTSVTPGITAKEYAQRRENLMARVPVGTVMIVPSHPEMMMSYDIPYVPSIMFATHATHARTRASERAC